MVRERDEFRSHPIPPPPHTVNWLNNGFVLFVQTLSLFCGTGILLHVPDDICLVQNLCQFLHHLAKETLLSALRGPYINSENTNTALWGFPWGCVVAGNKVHVKRK